MYNPEEVKKAKKRVKKKRDFYQHLMTFVIINCFLIALNVLTSPNTLWFQYPLLGWGIGLLFHYVDVFGVPGFDILSSEWEERELENELRRNGTPVQGALKEGKEEEAESELKLKELRKNYDESELV